jgi:antitoxin ParD1/3/4
LVQKKLANSTNNYYYIWKEVRFMPNVEKMSIALTPEMAAAVRAAVANGEYVSSSEVVREALRDWQLRRSLHQKEREELQRLWQEGTNSGPGNLASIQAIKAEARHRFEQAE